MENNKSIRRELTPEKWNDISAKIQDPALDLSRRAALRLKLFLEEETIVKNPGERIPAWRTIKKFPDIYAEGEKEARMAGHFIHEQGRICNISSDWEGVIRSGLLVRREGANDDMKMCIDAVIAYADKYEIEGLSRAIRTGARNYLEALQLFRILHFSLWASNVYHNTVGRFDQYMYPYFKKDTENGMTEAEALSLTEEFFLSFNRDSDLYIGMQQGDNGQSLMLGGCDADGNNAVNELTYICLQASLNNRRIDPKINLRVNKETPLELYEICTQLTKQGLGFPQYANDDVVIPALVEMGYDIRDARNYTVAACWEFIIPGVALDIPNIGAVSHAQVVHDVIRDHLTECESFEQLMEFVRAEELKKADEIEASLKPLWVEPAPYQSVLMSDWSHDISEGAKYNNYGIHGTGFATAVDQLAAVRKFVFEDKKITAQALLKALEDDFEGHTEVRHMLREEAPKLGKDVECDSLLDALINIFADSWKGRTNERGGIFRVGTGSAMYYLWHARELPSTADGRARGEVLSANFSPSLLVSDAGPLSVIRAMARPTLGRVCNGGPLTLELHDTVFKNEEGIRKVAQLVRSYILLGGHQLQLNAVSRETLLDAQIHPEEHKNLIVRVWGWSGHFIQLDRGYQDQIIERTSYSV
ncbi:MAG: pyruvate formate-lyase [Clostridiales bacterium]|nr:pyruvate formate-lyase [Clostridiales bacterium]